MDGICDQVARGTLTPTQRDHLQSHPVATIKAQTGIKALNEDNSLLRNQPFTPHRRQPLNGNTRKLQNNRLQRNHQKINKGHHETICTCEVKCNKCATQLALSALRNLVTFGASRSETVFVNYHEPSCPGTPVSFMLKNAL